MSGASVSGVTQVDVVVVAYNSRRTLRDCVQPLADTGWIHTIVVDNASPDRSAEVVADLAVTVASEPENRGFAAGCNAGWRRGSAPYVLFLNPDTRLTPDSVRTLAEALADPAVGAAGPMIRDDDGELDYSIRRFPKLRSTWAQAFFVHRLAPPASWVDEGVRDRPRDESAGPADGLSGACLLVRRDVLERLGGFDEGFFMYCEDTDLCRRIWQLGLAVRYEPAAVVEHAGGVSAPRSSLLPVLAASRVRYAARHRGRIGAVTERVGVAVASLTQAAVGRGGSAARRGHFGAAVKALRTA